MERRQRRIEEGAGALDAVELQRHRSARPSWTCEAGCGDWPCAAIRDHLTATTPPVEIHMVMGGYYPDAVRESPLPPMAVHRQLFGWIGRDTGPAASRGSYHAPGGPW